MKPKKRFRSLTAVTLLLAAAALIIWLAGMYCATAVTAEYAAARYLDGYREFASTIAARNFELWLGKGYSYKNYDEHLLWTAVDEGGRASSFGNWSSNVGGSSGFFERPNSGEVHSVTAIFDADGNCMEDSWRDFFYFEYLTEEQWENHEERSGYNARAYFDRTLLTEAGREMVSNSTMTFDAEAMRFTGTFDGIEFVPVKIECINEDDFRTALHAKGSGTFTVSGIVQDYNLQWITLYEAPDAVPTDAETVTFYSDWFDVCYSQKSPSFSYNGTKYGGLDALVSHLGPTLADGLQYLTRYEGLDLLIVSVDYCTTHDGKTYYSPYYYGEDAYAGEAPEMHFYTVSAVYCSPWRTAFGELRNVYTITFILSIILLLILRSQIKRNLVTPVQQINDGINRDWAHMDLYDGTASHWQEPYELRLHYTAIQDTLRMRQNEVNRLNTALEYAKDAEQNRRQMTSNVAHELKTPLAVIHSYAEGLKEHIAEDKRDKYIDVILSETEHLDDMVLELLDLSRLEAGKVKLALDTVSLIDLTHSVFERLDMAVQAKELTVSFDLTETCTIQADEARIKQVIENFVSNAVKYTPAGGNIRVTISRQEFRTRPAATTFAIENNSTPLSDEALSKVWETFYRTDDARSGGGTGLGLAIAKNIVELHGGTCAVRNTQKGVEFKFTI